VARSQHTFTDEQLDSVEEYLDAPDNWTPMGG